MKNKKLCVGIRGSYRELEEIINDESSKYIKEFFVAAPKEIVNTGRFKTHPVDYKTLEKITNLAHSSEIEITVLTNAFCLGKNDTSREFKNRYRDFILFLDKIGVNTLHIAHPVLIEIVRSLDVSIKIALSVYAEVTSPVLAKEYKQMGVNRINLPAYINKNLKLIKRIKEYANIPLELYVNSKCLNSGQCPYRGAHKCFKAHQEVLNEEDWDSIKDPYLAMCSARRKSNIFQIIYTPLVRPEDLHIYKKLGINTFKIATRSAPPEKTIQLVQAYGSEYFDGPIGELWTVAPNSQTPHNRVLDGVLEKIMDLPEEEQYEYYKNLAKKLQLRYP